MSFRLFSLVDVAKEIANRTQPLQQALEHLTREQQPIAEALRQLPKQIDSMLQSRSKSDNDRDNQTLINIEKKLGQALIDSPKRSDVTQEIDKSLQPFSHLIQTLKESKDDVEIRNSAHRFFRSRSILFGNRETHRSRATSRQIC